MLTREEAVDMGWLLSNGWQCVVTERGIRFTSPTVLQRTGKEARLDLRFAVLVCRAVLAARRSAYEEAAELTKKRGLSQTSQLLMKRAGGSDER